MHLAQLQATKYDPIWLLFYAKVSKFKKVPKFFFSVAKIGIIFYFSALSSKPYGYLTALLFFTHKLIVGELIFLSFQQLITLKLLKCL